MAELTGHPVRVYYKQPDEPDVLPPADAFVIAPATFNTINKLAGGVSDTLALGLLNEAVGLGLPIIAVPWPNADLARHPAFPRSVAALREWGVTVVLDPARLPRAGRPESAHFPWEALRAELVQVFAKLGISSRKEVRAPQPDLAEVAVPASLAIRGFSLGGIPAGGARRRWLPACRREDAPRC